MSKNKGRPTNPSPTSPTTPTPSLTTTSTVPVPETGPGAKPVAPVPVGRAWSPEVIDLRGLDQLSVPPVPAGVRVQIDRGQNAFQSMTEQQRMRVIIRVLCELVAYGEPPA